MEDYTEDTFILNVSSNLLSWSTTYLNGLLNVTVSSPFEPVIESNLFW
ncbi:hypothetical protein [Paenibacillus taihuensis]|nr:hypothetical protein [Paenibacillus taihuensis]